MSEQLDEYATKQIKLIVDHLNDLQISFDTRLLATLLTDRAAYLHGLLVKMDHLSEEEALLVWEQAADRIKNPPEKEIKTMSLVDGEILDPGKAN